MPTAWLVLAVFGAIEFWIQYNYLSKFYYIAFPLGAIFLLLCCYVFTLDTDGKINAALVIFSVSVPLFAVEIYLQLSDHKEPISLGIYPTDPQKIDRRTTVEVMENLRDQGVTAYPNISPLAVDALFAATPDLMKQERTLVPLGSISDVTTVHCNESGPWVIWESDEHGFNNPRGLYRNIPIDVLLVGDSFVEGKCVPRQHSIAGRLRDANFTAVSLGKGGNGSLIEYAALREYGSVLKPRIVFWMYYGNDGNDLRRELQSPILTQYLTSDEYTQGLIYRQNEIDNFLSTTFEQAYEYQKRNPPVEQVAPSGNSGTDNISLRRMVSKSSIIQVFKLTNIRERLQFVAVSPNDDDLLREKTTEILSKATQTVTDWGGQLYFVLLPMHDRYSNGIIDPMDQIVLDITKQLNMPVIDIDKAVFSIHDNPRSLFALRGTGHYVAEGYQLIAEEIIRYLTVPGR